MPNLLNDTKPYGRKDSSKFLFWNEVASLWNSGKSLLMYQHFIREKRSKFIQRMVDSVRKVAEGSVVSAFSTSHVLFLLALQPEHQSSIKEIIRLVQINWHDQIYHCELDSDQSSTTVYQELSDKQKQLFLSMAG
jgi:hypothetical protein